MYKKRTKRMGMIPPCFGAEGLINVKSNLKLDDESFGRILRLRRGSRVKGAISVCLNGQYSIY
jgi:hypothetical protein